MEVTRQKLKNGTEKSCESMTRSSNIRLDLTGQRFGKLTVIAPLSIAKNRYRQWLCQCDCGKKTIADTKELRRVFMPNCGCLVKTPRKSPPLRSQLDLTGRRFGHLTVLDRVQDTGKEKNCIIWRCRCDCGAEKNVRSTNLRQGVITDCGCIRSKEHDLTGRRFGRLTAMFATEKRNRKGSVIWHCRCDCGNEIDIASEHLLWSNTYSCGCRRAEIWKNFGEQKNLTFVDGTCLNWLEHRNHRSDSTTGVLGVTKTKEGLYAVNIGLQGKRYYLGRYKNFDEAVEIRKEAENELHLGFVRAYTAWSAMAERNPVWAKNHPFFFDVTQPERSRLRAVTIPLEECAAVKKP